MTAEYFSFWKPEPLPVKGKIQAIDLHPFGNVQSVIERLDDINGMTQFKLPWCECPKFKWHDVSLDIRIDKSIWPDEIVTINAVSSVSRDLFYKLYIQIYEQFGAVVLDEKIKDFILPRQFKYS